MGVRDCLTPAELATVQECRTCQQLPDDMCIGLCEEHAEQFIRERGARVQALENFAQWIIAQGYDTTNYREVEIHLKAKKALQAGGSGECQHEYEMISLQDGLFCKHCGIQRAGGGAD